MCSRRSTSSIATQLVRLPLLSLLQPQQTTASLLCSAGYFCVVTFFHGCFFREVLGQVHPHHPSRPWPLPGGRRGWPWRFALDGALAFIFTSRRCVVQVRCTGLFPPSSPLVTRSPVIRNCRPQPRESRLRGSSQGHKAGLFAVRKPEEQAAPFYFSVSFKASCLPSCASEHEVDVGDASRGIAPDACLLKFLDARYSLASGLMPWNISPTCLGTSGSTRAFARPATKVRACLQKTSLVTKKRATNPRTGGRPTQELSGNDPRTAGHRTFFHLDGILLPCVNYTLEPVRDQFTEEHDAVVEFSSLRSST